MALPKEDCGIAISLFLISRNNFVQHTLYEVIRDTKGKITLICKIGESASGRITNRATIKTSNGTGWRTNDYPNEITTTLKRNSVDVEKRALEIEKSADKTKVKPGESVTYTVDFENSSKGGFINGGP